METNPETAQYGLEISFNQTQKWPNVGGFDTLTVERGLNIQRKFISLNVYLSVKMFNRRMSYSWRT